MVHAIYLCVILVIIIIAIGFYNNKQTRCCVKCCASNQRTELEMIALNGKLAKEILDAQDKIQLEEEKYMIVYQELLCLNFFDREFYGRQLLSRSDSYVKQASENPDDFQLKARAEFYQKICADFSFAEPHNKEKACCAKCSKCGAKSLTLDYTIV